MSHGREELRGARPLGHLCALQQSRRGPPRAPGACGWTFTGQGTGCATRPQGQDPRWGGRLLGRKRGHLGTPILEGARQGEAEGSRSQRAQSHRAHPCPSVSCLSAGVPMLSVQPKGKQKGCAGCNRKIKDRYLLKALDKYWHEDCLKCACCDCRLGEVGSTLYTKANLILCRRDYLRWATSCRLVLLLREPPSSWAQHGPAPLQTQYPECTARVCATLGLCRPCPCPAPRDTHGAPQGRAMSLTPGTLDSKSISNHGHGEELPDGTSRSLPRLCQGLLTHPVPGSGRGCLSGLCGRWESSDCLGPPSHLSPGPRSLPPF